MKTKNVMELDYTHIRKVQDPRNLKAQQFLIPEGMHGTESSQHNYHESQPNSGRLSFDLEKHPSPENKKRLMNKALQYEFKLNDLNKYS